MTYIVNPRTGRQIKVGGKTYQEIFGNYKPIENGYKRDVARNYKPIENGYKRDNAGNIIMKNNKRDNAGNKIMRNNKKDNTGKNVFSPNKKRNIEERIHKPIEYTPTASKGCSNQSKWKRSGIPENEFCGPEGGSCPFTYPVDSPRHMIAALSYSNYAPNVEGLRRCVYRKAKERGFLREDGTIGK